MNSSLFWKFFAGIFILSGLVFLFVWSDGISHKTSGAAFETEKIVRSTLMLLTAWCSIRFITLTFLDPINKKRKKNLPNIVKDIIGIFIYFMAIVVIVTEVFGKSFFSVVLLVSPGLAVIGFAAKDLIADCINGIALDLQADFELGDWIEFKDGTIGKIIEMKMTGVDILLPNSSILFISNTMLNSDPMINLSKPERDYFVNIKVVLEHKVPVSRARRILLAAASSAPWVYNHEAKVFSESVQENGVVYIVYFKVSDRSVWLETRHRVIQSITEYLHKFDLKICQITGEINVSTIPNDADLSFNDKYVTSPIVALKMSKLLEDCDLETQKEFSQYMKLRKFQNGESIINQGEDGDSMFIIAEGVVDVDVELGLNQDRDNDGKEDTVEHRAACLVDGDYFGETALLLGEKRTATVIARTDAVIYEIDRETVKNIATKYSDFIDKISNSLAKRKLKNVKLKDELIKQKEDEGKAVSELVNAFKKYLWDH